MNPIIILVPIYFALGFLLALEGKKKKIGFYLTLILSILLTPAITVFFVMFSKRTYPKRRRVKGPPIDDD